MTDAQIKERLMERLLVAQSSWGSFVVMFYIRWKWISWMVVVKAKTVPTILFGRGV